MHEHDIYCIGKGKYHKPYEYGRKASVVVTEKSQIIVGVASHDKHEHDSKTLSVALESANSHRKIPVSTAVVDRGYKGCKRLVEADVILPSPPLKRDTQKEKNRKKRLCKKRSAIEPIIGHLKEDFRLTRNWLRGSHGDAINLLMSACAWNLRKWIATFFLFEYTGQLWVLGWKISDQDEPELIIATITPVINESIVTFSGSTK